MFVLRAALSALRVEIAGHEDLVDGVVGHGVYKVWDRLWFKSRSCSQKYARPVLQQPCGMGGSQDHQAAFSLGLAVLKEPNTP